MTLDGAGSNPVVHPTSGEVAERLKAPVCYTGGARALPRFESWLLRHTPARSSVGAERLASNQQVGSSNLPGQANFTAFGIVAVHPAFNPERKVRFLQGGPRGHSSVGRARRCQRRGRGFDLRCPHHSPYHPIGARPTGRIRDFDSRDRGSNPRRRTTPGRSSNGKTAGSKPANRRSNRRRPASTHTRRGRKVRREIATLDIPVQLRAACPLCPGSSAVEQRVYTPS